MLNINDVICDAYLDYETDKNMPKIVIRNQPDIIHYYYNKYLYAGYVNYIFNNVIDLYFQQKPLELSDDLRKDNKQCLLTEMFTNNKNELIYYDYLMPIYIDNNNDNYGSSSIQNQYQQICVLIGGTKNYCYYVLKQQIMY
jgi:hypothetical protein